MSDQIQTVTGPVAVSELGLTLPHEHLVFGMTGWQLDIVPAPSRAEQLEACERHARAAVEAGVRTMLELTTPEMGRDVELMREVSRRTGLRIACATGLYARRPAAYFVRRSEDEITELFVHELTEGIGDTRVRAAVIKCAVEAADLSDHERTVLRAAAQASQATGAPVVVHVEPGAALAVARFLAGAGLPGARTVIAHVESTPELRLLETLAGELDVFLGFDRFGYELTVTNQVRVATVAALCRQGHAGRVLLSHDYVCVLFGRDARRWDGMEDQLREWSFTYLPRAAMPALGRAGVSDADLHRMTLANPASLFG
jgi:phosphotriesterase-related protein